jgi:hypothetical protein
MTAGVTVSSLDERNGLLGSTYNLNGPLSLGSEHRSGSVGVSLSYGLGGGASLLFDGMVARTSGSAMTSGLIERVSPLIERAYGVSVVQADAFRPGDRLSFSIAKPLKVIGGSAQVLTASVDRLGYPVFSVVSAGLRPNGDETDLGVGYHAAPMDGVSLSTALDYRSDAYNVRGLDDLRARVSFSKSF